MASRITANACCPASPSGHDGIGNIEVEVIDFLASGINPSMSMVRLLSIAIASSSSGSICRYSSLALGDW